MLKLGYKVPVTGLLPEEYKDHYVSEVIRLGSIHGMDTVLYCADTIVLYSGPSRDVTDLLKSHYMMNPPRSEEVATVFGASRINDTKAAEYLDDQDFDALFRPVLSKTIRGKKARDNAVNKAHTTVWGGLSEVYVMRDFKRAETAVCGSDHTRVFVGYELPKIINNKTPHTINITPMEAVKHMFNNVNADEAFNLVCLSELKMTYNRATAATTGHLHHWNDFNDRLQFFVVERSLGAGKRPALSKRQQANKDAIVRDYGLSDLYTPPATAWGGPVAPRIPTIPVVSPRALCV